MKSIVLKLFIFSGILILVQSCKDFLEMPLITSSVTEDEIFANRENAESFLWQTYKWIIPYGWALYDKESWEQRLYRSMLCDYCDEANNTIGYTGATKTASAGFTPDDHFNRPDAYDANWTGIRKAWIFIENIDRVVDVPDEEKIEMKAELKTLIALRYSYMLGFYGGVPIVKKSLSVEDTLDIPRASFKDMVEFIVETCDSASQVLPDNYPAKWRGRVTKGVALAVKARTLLYAASPLFNTNRPILSFGEFQDLISYDSYDVNRWKRAADANKELIDWAINNGYKLINTGDPFDDFGNAVSKPDNEEIILSYKANVHEIGWTKYYLGDLGKFNEGHNITFNILPLFYKEDGNEQTWPRAGDPARPYSEYLQKMNEMEPRFKQTAWIYGQDAWTNPGLPRFRWKTSSTDGSNAVRAGVAKLVKFTYKYRGGSDASYAPDWIVYRLAEFYLNYAEAINEYNPNDSRAYDALNEIRRRAGLPLIDPADPRYNTQEKLREIIWRERAIELFAEGHRFFDVRRWLIADQEGVTGGPFYAFKYNRNSNQTEYIDYQVFQQEDRTWRDRMYFAPFPQSEVDKGILVQNPGY